MLGLRDRGAYLGVVAGRYANRIAGASFELDGRRHELVANVGPHCCTAGRPASAPRCGVACRSRRPRMAASACCCGARARTARWAFPARDVGCDHNWLLDHPLDGARHPAARLAEPASGRWMEISTTEPAIQLYAGTWMDGSLNSPVGMRYARGAGLCPETQHHPDSPHRAVDAEWPSTLLRPGEAFRSATLHRFGAA